MVCKYGSLIGDRVKQQLRYFVLILYSYNERIRSESLSHFDAVLLYNCWKRIVTLYFMAAAVSTSVIIIYVYRFMQFSSRLVILSYSICKHILKICFLPVICILRLHLLFCNNSWIVIILRRCCNCLVSYYRSLSHLHSTYFSLDIIFSLFEFWSLFIIWGNLV